MSERTPLLTTEQQAGIWNEVIRRNNYFNIHGYQVGYTEMDQNEGCDDVLLDVHVNPDITLPQDPEGRYAEIQAQGVWNGDPKEGTLTFDGPGDNGGTQVDRGSQDANPNVWHVRRSETSQSWTIELQVPRGDVICTDEETVTIDALQQPTNEPTETPIPATAPSDIPTTEPTIVPPTVAPPATQVPQTAIPTQASCIATDVKGQFVFSGDPRSHQISDPTRFLVSNISLNLACKDDTYIQVFQAPPGIKPNSDGTMPLDGQILIDRQRIDIPEGANNQQFTRDLPNSVGPRELWCQVDLTRDPISEARQAVGDVMIDYGFYQCVTKKEESTATPTTAPSATTRPTSAPSPTPTSTRTATATHTVRPTPEPNNEPDDTKTPTTIATATNTETTVPASSTRTPAATGTNTNTSVPVVHTATPKHTKTATPVTPIVPLPETGGKEFGFKETGKIYGVLGKSTNDTLLHLDPLSEAALAAAALLCLAAGGIGAYAKKVAKQNP